VVAVRDRSRQGGIVYIVDPSAGSQGRAMADLDLFHQINVLSCEEEALYASASSGDGLSQAEVQRLEEIKVELDRVYDLLHQRQARAAAGLNPDEATERPADVVERYQQ
jgi:hypothetical protein